MKKENINVVLCPPCGEQPLAPEGFNPGVGLPTKRGFLNKETSFTTPLPRLSAVLPPQGREITAHGFTLIELLVVVLIIGILAAVAVPQYQKAVAKSRFIQLQTAGDAFIKSYKLYRLANGEDPTTFEQLDILSLPNISEEDKTRATSGNIQCKISTSAELTCWQKDPTLAKNSPDFVYFFPTSTAGLGKAGKRICRGFNELHKEVCLNVGGTYVNDGSTYTDYILP